MSTNAIEIKLPEPGRVGQATAVEQSRAVAEVQAAVIVARQFPRNTQAAIRHMEDTCRNKQLALQAFYSFKRSGSNVTGPTIYLARELARIWGNIDVAVRELRRDDEFGQSEMLAYAWDLETNTRVSTGFIVPHFRDKSGGAERLTSMRDIYESNANNGARRLRECVFAVLPKWFSDDAQSRCRATIEDGGGEPLAQRIAKTIAVYAKDYSVDEARLEAFLERASAKWNEYDLGQLVIVGQSLRRGERTVAEAFPIARVTAADITTKPAAEWREEEPPEGVGIPRD